MIQCMILQFFLLVAAVEDLYYRRISNRFLIVMAVVGAGCRLSEFLKNCQRTPGEVVWQMLQISFWMLVPVVALWLFFRMRVLGAGDLKLLAVTGLFLGEKTGSLILTALVLTAIIGSLLLLVKENFWCRLFKAAYYLLEILKNTEIKPYYRQCADALTVPFAVMVFLAQLLRIGWEYTNIGG